MEPKGLILAENGQERGSPMDRQWARHMLPIANKPILVHALESMASAGITEVVVATTADAMPRLDEVVSARAPLGMRIAYVPTEGTGCVAAALLAAREYLDGNPFVAQHGDGLLHSELRGLLEAFQRQEERADALLLVEPVYPGGRRVGRIEGLRWRAAPTDGRGLAMAGVQIFGGGFLALADDYIRSNRPIADLADLGADVARSSAHVSVRRVEGWRRFEGDPNVLLDMNRLILEGLDAHDERPSPDSRVEGRVSIHSSARIASSLIRGPVVVGANASVENAFVGPYTAIGEGARIEGAEIENSIIFPGAVVSHVAVAGRLESCVIGRNARVERRFSIPRAMRVHLGDSASVQLG